MPLLIPPHIKPPDKVGLDVAMLRNTAHCVIHTWPRTMYDTDFQTGPAGYPLYVMQPDAVREVLLNQVDNFPQSRALQRIIGPVWRKGLATASGADWRWQRKAAAPAFTPGASTAVVSHACRAAETLANDWRVRGEIAKDIIPDLGGAVTDVVLGALLDDAGSETERRRLLDIADGMTTDMGRLNYADILRLPRWTRPLLGPTFERSIRKIHPIISQILIRKTQGDIDPSSLLALLTNSNDPETGKTMSGEILQDNVTGFLAAGRETTVFGLGWTLMLLAMDKTIQRQVADEVQAIIGQGPVTPEHANALDLTRRVFMEALRLYPPAPQISRDCSHDTTIAGHAVKAGTMVTIPVYVIHRHRRLWDNPDAFDPDRFLPGRFDAREARFRYLPFGAGPRTCIGMHFATTEAVVMLATLVRALEFDIKDPGKINFAVGAALRPSDGLRLSIRAC